MSNRTYLLLAAAIVVLGTLFTVGNILTNGVTAGDFVTAVISVVGLGFLAAAWRSRRRRDR